MWKDCYSPWIPGLRRALAQLIQVAYDIATPGGRNQSRSADSLWLGVTWFFASAVGHFQKDPDEDIGLIWNYFEVEDAKHLSDQFAASDRDTLFTGEEILIADRILRRLGVGEGSEPRSQRLEEWLGRIEAGGSVEVKRKFGSEPAKQPSIPPVPPAETGTPTSPTRVRASSRRKPKNAPKAKEIRKIIDALNKTANENGTWKPTDEEIARAAGCSVRYFRRCRRDNKDGIGDAYRKYLRNHAGRGPVRPEEL
jgi:hypothetical protein